MQGEAIAERSCSDSSEHQTQVECRRPKGKSMARSIDLENCKSHLQKTRRTSSAPKGKYLQMTASCACLPAESFVRSKVPSLSRHGRQTYRKERLTWKRAPSSDPGYQILPEMAQNSTTERVSPEEEHLIMRFAGDELRQGVVLPHLGPRHAPRSPAPRLELAGEHPLDVPLLTERLQVKAASTCVCRKDYKPMIASALSHFVTSPQELPPSFVAYPWR
jgi:hypothetical protein